MLLIKNMYIIFSLLTDILRSMIAYQSHLGEHLKTFDFIDQSSCDCNTLL